MTTAARVPVVDLWVNVLPEGRGEHWAAQTANRGIEGLLGSDWSGSTDAAALVGLMDRLGVDTAVLAGALSPARPGRLAPTADIEALLAMADAHPGRLLVAGTVDRSDRPVEQVRRLRELAAHPAYVLTRVTPLTTQVPLNAAVLYPVYAACVELALPVSINVGVPGPRVRSACQHPELLEDLLIDLPDLVVIGAHMGHPYEALLMQYMLKWPNLYLSTTAYSCRYLDPALVAFMGSRRGAGRVLFGSDHPFLPLTRALDAARALPLPPDELAAFLGGTAIRLLTRRTAP